MYTRVKSSSEIEAMRKAGSICSDILAMLAKEVKPNMSTGELAGIAAEAIKSSGSEAAFLGYNGFPDAICISVNDEVVHGIPSQKKIVHPGDIISFDLGIKYQGMIVDSAISVLVDSKDKQKLQLLDSTRESLGRGLEVVRAGCKIGDIGNAIQEALAEGNYGIIRDLVGHGVGHHVHEEPNIPNYGISGVGAELKEGMTLAIEPMATLGGEGVYIDEDKWTVKTRDGSLAAHFEQTILVRADGCEILTPFL